MVGYLMVGGWLICSKSPSPNQAAELGAGGRRPGAMRASRARADLYSSVAALAFFHTGVDLSMYV